MKPIFFIRVAFLMACLFFISQSYSQTRTLKANTPATDNCNGYYEFLPAGYNDNPNEKFPLILYFHGLGSTGNGSVQSLLDKIVLSGSGTPPWRSWANKMPNTFEVGNKQIKYILITPQFLNEAFLQPEKYIGDFLNYVIAHYKVDLNKIYLAGQSGNAYAVLKFAGSKIENAYKIAAIAVSSVAGNAEQSVANIISAAKIPVWIVASKYEISEEGSDPEKYSKYAQSWYNAIKNATPLPYYLPRLQLYDDDSPNHHNGHGDAAFILYNPATIVDGKNVYQWLFSFDRAVLPVTGMDIRVKAWDGALVLSWNTYSEINNTGFNIQQSSDGTTFANVGFVPASGKSTGASYTFKVKNPVDGINYFRLEQIDIDGRTSFSKIVNIQFDASNKVIVAPNPVYNMLKLNFDSHPGGSIIQIFNNTGKLVREIKTTNPGEIQIDVSGFSKGFYTGRIITNENPVPFSFVKK